MLLHRHLPAPQRGAAFDALGIGLDRAGAGIEALDRGAEAVLEVQPAHLAVADHVEANPLLEFHRGAHRLVLDRAKRCGVELALIESFARLDHGSRPQQAADHVGADRFQVAHGPGLTIASGRG